LRAAGRPNRPALLAGERGNIPGASQNSRAARLYASDYPHSGCQFPDSVDNILAWTSLDRDTREKLLWGKRHALLPARGAEGAARAAVRPRRPRHL